MKTSAQANAHTGIEWTTRKAGLLLTWILVSSFISLPAQADSIRLDYQGNIHAAQNTLDAEYTVQLRGAQALYNLSIDVIHETGHHTVHRQAYWSRHQPLEFAFSLPVRHTLPGDYHLILQVHFQDSAGAPLTLSQAFNYTYQQPAPVATHNFKLHIKSAKFEVSPQSDTPATKLVLTRSPMNRFPEVRPQRLKQVNHFSQLALISWEETGFHHSQIRRWYQTTDGQSFLKPPIAGTGISTKFATLALSIILLALIVLLGGFRSNPASPGAAIHRPGAQLLIVGLCMMTVLLSNYPESWLYAGWPASGDMASQNLGASQLHAWIREGRLSHWSDATFAGLPAFTYYFPLPFILADILAIAGSLATGLKLAILLPALLMPLAGWVLARQFDRTSSGPALFAIAITGFVLHEGNTIWGGNLLAQLAGEFAYGWGMLFCLLFFTALSATLRSNSRKSLLASVALLVMTALSHGFALLVAGFGAFFWLIIATDRSRALKQILLIHTLAFLCLGIWLMPLLGNLPWTLPNDHPFRLYALTLVAPPHLLPWLALSILATVLYLRRPMLTPQVQLFLLLPLLPLGGFLLGHTLGLAEIRFYPFFLLFVLLAGTFWLAQLIHSRQRTSLWVLVITFTSISWYQFNQHTLPSQVLWNNEGILQKPAAQALQQTAELWPRDNGNPLRIAFDHHPENRDMGSTRALEALPLLGSQPVLEGLYMESALLAPMIYQVQADISRYPSSPVARYPVNTTSRKTRTARLHEFGVAHLLIREQSIAAELDADPDWQRVAQRGPLTLYNARTAPALVELIKQPLVGEPSRTQFRERSFVNFRTAFPYQSRMVYTDHDALPEQIPSMGTHMDPPQLVQWKNDQIRFRTHARGQPHMIKSSWHPDWRSRGGETLYMVEPGFILIYPNSETVELYYQPGMWYLIGQIFSLFGLLACLLIWLRVSRHFPLPNAWIKRIPFSSDSNIRLPVIPDLAVRQVFIACLLVFTMVVITDSERLYHQGHRFMTQKQYAKAAYIFDYAFAQRDSDAARAEALFWSARNYHFSGYMQEAAERYRKLIHTYPQSTWLGEATFRLLELSDSVEEKEQIIKLAKGLYPDARWVRRIKAE